MSRTTIECGVARRSLICRLLTLTAAVALGSVLAVENGAQQVDSGWAVGTPPAIAKGTKHSNPRHQLTLQQVLQQSQTPLLRIAPTAKQAPLAAPPQRGQDAKGEVRFAVRPDGVEGWRPAGQPAAPLEEQPPTGTQEQDANRLPKADVPQLQPPNNADSSVAVPGIELAPSTKTDDARSQPTANTPRSTVVAEEPAASQSEFPASDQENPLSDGPVGVDDPADATEESQNDDDIGPIEDDDFSTQQAPAVVEESPPPLTRQLVALRSRVRSVLKGYYRRQLNSRDHDPWEVMHGMLAYGVHSRIRQGGPRGAPVTSVGWLCYNKPCKKLNLLYVNPQGELRAKYGVGLQGHLGQLLAMLAQCRVSEEYPIHVGNREFTIADLIEAEKKTCYPKSELTFKLIALQYYLDLNETWLNDQGLEWDIPRLIREELAQPIRGAACGGTHRLSGLSLTVKTRLRRGEPLDGEYARAAAFVERYHRYAFRLQNRDGSLSTSWFRGRGDESDIDRRIKTTGHILEWLCYSLSDQELRDQKTVAAVSYLANLMYREYDHEWEVGPMSHAIHALLVYDERVFQPFDSTDYNTAYKPKSRFSTMNGARQSSNRR